VKKHNSNQYINMKTFKAATILRKKEGRKERKKEREKQTNKKQTTESVLMTKHHSAAPHCC